MRLIIAGGRGYAFTELDPFILDQIPGVTEVISGGARGADKAGEEWAKSRGLPCTVFPAEWSKHGYRAGPVRNSIMAMNADALAAFPGGNGTDDMVKKALKVGLEVYDFRLALTL